MRILVIGNFSSEYVRDSWKKPLEKYGDTIIFDVVPFLAQKNSDSNYCQKYIFKLIRNNSIDIIYFYSDGLLKIFPDSFFENIRKEKIPIITFHADDEPEKWYQQNRTFDYRFDLIATHSKRAWERRQQDGSCNKIVYTPWGYNPDFFYPIPNLKKKYDVVFIGKYKKAGLTSIEDEDGLLRQDILVQMYDLCKRNKLNFRVFGMGWNHHPILKDVYGGLLTHQDMLEVYSKTRIVFNPSFSSDDNLTGYQTKLRHYEVPGCGAFQITNDNPELLDHFIEDKEIVLYKNLVDLEKKTLFYIKNNTQRERIALNSFNRVKKCHTTYERIKDLFDYAKRFFSIQENKNDRAILEIAQIIIGDNKSIKREHNQFLISSLEKLPDILSQIKNSYDYVHIIPQNLDDLDIEIDYKPVLSQINSLKNISLFSVRSVIRFDDYNRNFVQVNWHNFSGLIFYEDSEKTEFQLNLEGFISNYLPFFKQDNKTYFLSNYIFKMSEFELFSQRINNNEKQFINNNLIYHTYSIINNISIKSSQDVVFSEKYRKYEILFRNLGLSGKKILIYGARGYPIPIVTDYIKKYNIHCAGFVDRSLAGQKIHKLPVFAREDIDNINPDVILISAENSGHEIYQSLSDLNCKALVIPLYDTSDVIWEVGF